MRDVVLPCLTFNSFKQTVHCTASEFHFLKYFYTELLDDIPFAQYFHYYLNFHWTQLQNYQFLLLSHIIIATLKTLYKIRRRYVALTAK